LDYVCLFSFTMSQGKKYVSESVQAPTKARLRSLLILLVTLVFFLIQSLGLLQREATG
jgi:hypothetical protein